MPDREAERYQQDRSRPTPPTTVFGARRQSLRSIVDLDGLIQRSDVEEPTVWRPHVKSGVSPLRFERLGVELESRLGQRGVNGLPFRQGSIETPREYDRRLVGHPELHRYDGRDLTVDKPLRHAGKGIVTIGP